MAKHEAQVLELDVDNRYSKQDRIAIAEDMVDEIVDRTLAQKGADGAKFEGLSKDYKKFKGRAIGSRKADLRFTGEMLGKLQVIKSKSSKGKIVIGYKSGTKENAKCKGHRTGDVGVKRDFLGDKDSSSNASLLRDITDNYPVEDKEERRKRIEAALALREKIRNGKKNK